MLKTGLFSKVLLLRHESRAEYTALLNGFREDLQPQGTLETLLVENLAVLCWRKRRLLVAENAEVANAAQFNDVDRVEAQILEIWDRSRAGETAGGMVRYSSNPYLIREAVDALIMVRNSLEKFGFRKDEDPRMLRKLYGLDHDGAAPLGILRAYQLMSKLATVTQTGNEDLPSPDNLKKDMLQIFDKEIKRLEYQEILQTSLNEERGKYQALALLVPSQGAIDRLIRYEAHISREFDRILNELERIQRTRRGQPVPPSIRLELSR